MNSDHCRPPRAAALLSFLLLAAPAIAAASGSPFQPGEGFVWSFSVGAVEAGRVRVSVGDPTRGPGRRKVAVQGDVQSAPWLALFARVEDIYKVVLDADSLSPSSIDNLGHGLRERHVKMAIDGPRVAMDITRPSAPQRRYDRNLPGAPVDMIGALFAIRAASLEAGQKFSLLVVDGPFLYRTNVEGAGHTTVERQGRKVPVVRAEIEAIRVDDAGNRVNFPVRHGTLWLTDDERRVPIVAAAETDIGQCTVDLVSYREPTHSFASLGPAPIATAPSTAPAIGRPSAPSPTKAPAPERTAPIAVEPAAIPEATKAEAPAILGAPPATREPRAATPPSAMLVRAVRPVETATPATP